MTVADFVPGQITAAQLNVLVAAVNGIDARAALTDPLGARKGCRIRRVANQSVANSSTQTISWDTEDDDQGGFFAPTSTTITIPTGLGGLYAVTFVPDPATSPATRFIANIVPNTALSNYPTNIRAAGNNEDVLSVSGFFPLLAGDSLTFSVFQNSGAADNFTAWASCYRVGV